MTATGRPLTINAGRRRRTAPLAAISLAVALAAAGCGDGGSPARAQGDRTVQRPDAAGAAGIQSTPQDAAAAFYDAIRDADYATACALLAPAVRERAAATVGDCPSGLARSTTPEDRAKIGKVSVDAALVENNGPDVASVPGAAITNDGAPSRLEGVDVTRQAGLWFIVNTIDVNDVLSRCLDAAAGVQEAADRCKQQFSETVGE